MECYINPERRSENYSVFHPSGNFRRTPRRICKNDTVGLAELGRTYSVPNCERLGSEPNSIEVGIEGSNYFAFGIQHGTVSLNFFAPSSKVVDSMIDSLYLCTFHICFLLKWFFTNKVGFCMSMNLESMTFSLAQDTLIGEFRQKTGVESFSMYPGVSVLCVEISGCALFLNFLTWKLCLSFW